MIGSRGSRFAIPVPAPGLGVSGAVLHNSLLEDRRRMELLFRNLDQRHVCEGVVDAVFDALAALESAVELHRAQWGV